MEFLYDFLAFLPILVLLIFCFWKGVKPGIYAGTFVTVLLFFVWGGGILHFFASLIHALVGTVNIMMIIFGAVFLYQVMDQKGYISGIKKSLHGVHSEKSFRFYFLSFFLTAFFESVAGFGTPGAIVPVLLVSMGFSPVYSVSSVLLFDGLFALAGAVGTPVAAGFELPLGLDPLMVKTIYRYSGYFMALAGIPLFYFVIKSGRHEMRQINNYIPWLQYTFILLPFGLLSGVLYEISGISAALVFAILNYLIFFQNKNPDLKPWIPYWVLVGLLVIPKMIPLLEFLLSYKYQWVNILETEINTSIQPLKSPLVPFLLAGLLALYLKRDFSIDLKPVVSKTAQVFLVLYPSLVLTQLMINSSGERQSMIAFIASVFSGTGVFYPLISPFIGVLGAFISGSTTVSNIIFGSVQLSAAQNLNMEPEVLLALQLCGASLGNAICLFNIIAASAVVGLNDFSAVLRKNSLPVFLAAVVCSLAGYLVLYFF